MNKDKTETAPVNTDVIDEDVDDTERATKIAKLKKLALWGGAALAVTGVVTVIVMKARGSNLPEITDIIPE